MNRRYYHKLGEVGINDVIFTRRYGKVVATKLLEIKNTANGAGCATKYRFKLANGEEENIFLRCGYTDYPHARFYYTIEDCIRDINRIPFNIIELNEIFKGSYGFTTQRHSSGMSTFGLTNWKWDGFQPIKVHVNHFNYELRYDHDGWTISYTGKDMLYLTREQCAKDNAVEVVMF